jgi:hypothetical protein
MSLGFGFSLPAYTGSAASFGAGATLALDFTSGNQTLDPRITFTRATTATFTGSNGLIQTAAIDAPRFDYNPTTLAPLGLLIEEQRTNLLTYSEQFDNAAWTKTRSSITADATTSPDGTVDADKLVEDTDNNSHHVGVNFSFTSGTTYTISVYAKAAERPSLQIALTNPAFGSTVIGAFDLLNGLSTGSGGTGRSQTITPIGNQWYRCSLTISATATATSAVRFYIASTYSAASVSSYTGDGTSGIYIWGAQLEAGAFPTSYIPTVASQVTRSADVAVMTGTNFSDWYNQAEGTIYGEYVGINNVSGGTRRLLEIGVVNATTDRFVCGYSQTNNTRFLVVASGTAQADVTVNTIQGSLVRFAGVYAANNFQTVTNGVLSTADTSGTVPVVSSLFIGSDQTSVANTVLNGHIRQIAYYPRRLANSELQAITS